jgi:hypothetical protein
LIYFAIAIAVVGAVAWWVLFRRPTNQFVIEVGKMQPKQRAAVLLSATIWRVNWESENPQFAGIFLEPKMFPDEVYAELFENLFDIVVVLLNQRKVLQKRLHDFGSKDQLPDDDLYACRLWMGTIGARCGKIKVEDMTTAWKYFREAVPAINEAMVALKERHELHQRLRLDEGREFLEGIPPGVIIQQAQRVPNLI